MPIKAVLDTNILYAGLRSRQGASYRLLKSLGNGIFQPCVSVPLVLEYQQILLGKQPELGLPAAAIEDVIDYLCLIAHKQRVFYLWRPMLKDPKDDMVLEFAVAAECQYIVTYNRRDFHGTERFGIATAAPKEFLQVIGELP